jgi:hypothetical protein
MPIFRTKPVRKQSYGNMRKVFTGDTLTLFTVSVLPLRWNSDANRLDEESKLSEKFFERRELANSLRARETCR